MSAIPVLRPSKPTTPQAGPRFGLKAWNEEASDALVKALRENRVMAYGVDLQKDFMLPRHQIKNGLFDGLYVPGAEEVIAFVQRLTNAIADFVLGKKPFSILHILSRDTHETNDAEFSIFRTVSKRHCVKGTPGWDFVDGANISNSVHVIDEAQSVKDVPSAEEIKSMVTEGSTFEIRKNAIDVDKHRGIIGEHPETKAPILDIVDNVKAYQLFNNFKKSGRNVALVYGVATDYCVRGAVAFLKMLGITPIVVKDAIKGIAPDALSNPDAPTSIIMEDVQEMTTAQLAEVLAKAEKS